MCAAIYLRISRDLTGQRLGVDRQRVAAEKYALTNDYDVAEVFTDNDISAADGKRRPGFESLLDALADGRVSVVIAWNWDRLTRNRPDTVQLIETCQRTKAKVVLVRGSDLDMSTPSGRMTAGILAEVAQNEIETKVSARVSPSDSARRWGAQFAVRVQIAFIYFHSATSKFAVDTWADGTQMYYVTRQEMFGSSGPIGDNIRDLTTSPFVTLALSWGAIAMELAIAVLVFFSHKRAARTAIFLSAVLHLSIIAIIGLGSFGLIMVGVVICAAG